jgi:radical SAM protein with 4Fe4S-binding SPASM domain
MTIFDQNLLPPPFLVSWNLTRRCNLKCGHCYLDSTELTGSDPMDTAFAFKVVDEIAETCPSAMLILTGGEPLLRPDVFDIASAAAKKGLFVVLGTNGTLIDSTTAGRLKESGVKGVGVSLDSATPAYHDAFRGAPGSWTLAMRALEELKNAGLPFQVHFSVTRENKADLPAIVALAEEAGAIAVNVFFLVCTGRGQDRTDLNPDEYEKILEYLCDEEGNPARRTMVRARCAPHMLRVANRLYPDSPLLRGHTSGCIAGSGYLRITPEGFITACPYMPASTDSPNILKDGLATTWQNSEVFTTLRTRRYDGKCRDCEHSSVCGGCRARALASGGALMGEDPWCAHEPKGFRREANNANPAWSAEATERLSRVPVFLRAMVKRRVEDYARLRGAGEISPEMMAELKKRFDGIRK